MGQTSAPNYFNKKLLNYDWRAVYSFLKTQYSLTVNKVRGLGNVASYALFSVLCLVLNREAAENIDR